MKGRSMVSTSWPAAALTATAVALAAAPLVYYQWQRQRAERQEALRLLRKVELIAGEVNVRLTHLESQSDDYVKFKRFENHPEEWQAGRIPAPSSSLNSYYHFDSQGNKLKTKWDGFDADAELERLDSDEEAGAAKEPKLSNFPERPRQPALSKPTLLAAADLLEHEFEAVLEFLDDVRGDEEVRQLRKGIAKKVTTEMFSRIDAIRTILNEHE